MSNSLESNDIYDDTNIYKLSLVLLALGMEMAVDSLCKVSKSLELLNPVCEKEYTCYFSPLYYFLGVVFLSS